jgi:hypothetical protein
VLRYDAALLSAAVDEHDASDGRLKEIWGGKMYRVRLALKAPAAEGVVKFTVARG